MGAIVANRFERADAKLETAKLLLQRGEEKLAMELAIEGVDLLIEAIDNIRSAQVGRRVPSLYVKKEEG